MAELALGDLLIGKHADILVALVTDDGVVELADLVATALDHLDEQVIGDTEKACDSQGRIVFPGLM
jgi:hypothetical protein